MTTSTELVQLLRPMRLADGQEAEVGAVLELPRPEAAAAVHNRKAAYVASQPTPLPDNGYPTEGPDHVGAPGEPEATQE